jgi:uncharacterized membrane protein YqjE
MPEASIGFFGSLRRIGETLLAIVQSRLELISHEWREEKTRAVSIAIWGALMVFMAFMSMIAVTFLFVFVFWDQAVWVLLGFSIFYLGGAALALFVIRSRLKAPLFAETISQLKKDRSWLCSGK